MANPDYRTLVDQVSKLKKQLGYKQIKYSDGPLSGPVTCCNIFGIDKLTGDLYYKNNAGNWELLSSGNSSANSWLLTGNTATDPLVNFLGTTDNKDLVLKTNNTEIARFKGGVSRGIQLGTNAVASGVNSLATQLSTASGLNSFSVVASTAVGANSVALGNDNYATGANSVSIGQSNTSVGINSITLGTGNTATGVYATAIGRGSIAKSYAGVVVGEFNDTSDLSNPTVRNGIDRIFQIGIGNSNTLVRNNAVTVLRNGNTGINTLQPHSKLHGGGSFALPIIVTQDNFTATENEYTISVNCDVNPLTVTLPNPTTLTGRIYVVKRFSGDDTGVVTINSTGGTFIQGKDLSFNTTTTLGLPNTYSDKMTFQSDGNIWQYIQ